MAPDNALMRRPSSTRKSLSIPASTASLRDKNKKRSYSLAPVAGKQRDDDLTPRRRQRRSLVPSRGILKQSTSFNGKLNSQHEDLTQHSNTALSIGNSDLVSMDTTTAINFDTRKSLGGDRRVSFAAHAHVRLFDKEPENTNGSSTPPSSPSEPSPQPANPSPPNVLMQAPPRQRRSSALSNRRRSSLRGLPDEDGEESMVLDSDDSGDVQYPTTESSQDEENLTTDMDLTDDLAGPSTSNRRRSSVRRRESTLSEPMEFTVAVEHGIRGPDVPNETWLQLQALANGTITDLQQEPDVPADMDLDQALERMRAAGGNLSSNGDANSTFSSMSDDSFGGDENQTINVTAMMMSADMEETVNLSAAIKAAPASSPIRPTLSPRNRPNPQSSRTSTGIFVPPPPISKAIPTPTALSKIPIGATPRRPGPGFSAAFAPSVKSPKKRPFSGTNEEERGSPAKRFAADVAGEKRAVPAPLRANPSQSGSSIFTARPRPSNTTSLRTKQEAPTRQSTSSRRPSGFYRGQRNSESGGKAGPLVLQDESHTATTRIPLGDVTPVLVATLVEEALADPQEEDPVAQPPTFRVRSPTPVETVDDDQAVVYQAIQENVLSNPDFPSIEEEETAPDYNISLRAGGSLSPMVQPLQFISLAAFLETTGIAFMDGITHTRRSTFNGIKRDEDDKDPTLADYVIAMAVEYGQYEFWNWASNQMDNFMQDGENRIKELAADVDENPPMLFGEYVEADEEGRMEIEAYLALLKTNSRHHAKSVWYDWRTRGVNGLQETADEHKALLLRDNEAILAAETEVDDVLPDLEGQLRLLDLELESELASVAEIEGCDQQQLKDLRHSIEEQEVQLDLQRKDLAEAEEKCQRLRERLEDLNAEIKEAKYGIEEDKTMMQILKGSTRTEMLRKREQLDLLQTLVLWRATNVSPDLMQFIYDGRYQASIYSKQHVPALSFFRLEQLPQPFKDPLPVVTRWVVDTAQQRVQSLSTGSTNNVIKQLYCYFGSCELFRTEVMLMRIKYPLQFTIFKDDEQLEGLAVTAILLYKRSQAKAHVTFRIQNKTLNSWPRLIQDVDCVVSVVYGEIDADGLLDAVRDRLAQATLEENYAILVDACAEAASCYD